MVEKKLLTSKVAALESQIDLMQTELIYLNSMLIGVGFSKGIVTLKESMREMMEKENCSSTPFMLPEKNLVPVRAKKSRKSSN